MLTDWLLIGRAARELDAELDRARVQDVGLLEDGRVGLAFWTPNGARLLAADCFAPTPLVTLGSEELAITREPGYLRAVALALRGASVLGVNGRTGDRLIVLQFGSRSRFGVDDEHHLVLELTPRFGNLVLLKGETVIAAAKQFAGNTSGRRIKTGAAYAWPPLPAPAGNAETLEQALREIDPLHPDAVAVERAARALRALRPLVPKLLAESYVHDLPRDGATRSLAERLLGRADHFLAELDSAPAGRVFVYRRAGELVQAHVVPLHQFDALERSTQDALLPLFSEARTSQVSHGHGDPARLRAKLEKQLARHQKALERERAALESRQRSAEQADVLRRCGEILYAHAFEIAPGSARFVSPSSPELVVELDPDKSAKENAAGYFARYRKLISSRAPLEKRQAIMVQRETALDELRWELARADAASLAEVCTAIESLDRRRRRAVAEPAGKRKPLTFVAPSGAQVIVGRSPVENAHLTFTVARPTDWWFHARGIPGAHVILRTATPTENDFRFAASLAALHSKTSAGSKVTVDYAQRKHVRKQKDAPPGRVFYTNHRSCLVAPAKP